MDSEDFDIGDDLHITGVTPREVAGGTWVTGTLNGYRFEALVFPDHADCQDYELGDSRISKLWILCEADRKVVCHFDRGWNLQPATDKAAAIADFLAAGLAEDVYAT